MKIERTKNATRNVVLFFINAVISFLIPNIIFFAVYGRNKFLRESLTQIGAVVLKNLRKSS